MFCQPMAKSRFVLFRTYATALAQMQMRSGLDLIAKLPSQHDSSQASNATGCTIVTMNVVSCTAGCQWKL